MAVSSLSPNDANDQTKVPGTAAPRPTPTLVIGKVGAGLSGETQIRNGRPRGEARSRTQLLPRYWPRITDQELQKISGEYPNVGHVSMLYYPNHMGIWYVVIVVEVGSSEFMISGMPFNYLTFEFWFPKKMLHL